MEFEFISPLFWFVLSTDTGWLGVDGIYQDKYHEGFTEIKFPGQES